MSDNEPVGPALLDVSAGMAAVEARLEETASSTHPLVQEAATYLIRAGGKRFRPMLVLTSGRVADGGEDPRLVDCGAAIELTHLATLYHDDVIEDAPIRRGVPTVNARYGNHVAVLTGDFLLARASGLAADLGPYVSRRLADTIAELCEGQIMEGELAWRRDAHGAEYLEVIRRKTASLIATSCHLGAWLSGSPEPVVEAMTAYGEALGMVFQLSDDILDVIGDESVLGKSPGTDLRVGVFTLPALETFGGSVPGAPDLHAALDANDIGRAIEVLAGNGSLDKARDAVREWQEKALKSLEGVPAGPARELFESLATSVGRRDR